jgi:hypothetical protein
MPWVKIDEVFPRHPKVVQVGPLGIALQVAALCYCNHYLTDGFVPFRAVRGLLDFNRIGIDASSDSAKFEHWQEIGGLNIAADLVEVGMWEEVEGGFQIHDYADYQPTRAEVIAERERNSRAGKLGAAAREAARQQPAKRGGKQRAKPSAKRDAKQRVNNLPTPRQAKSKPVPVPEDPMVKASGMGTVEGGSGGGAASPSSAIASGDADSAAQNPNGVPPSEAAKHALGAALGRIRAVPDSPPPRSREEQLAALERDMADDPKATT